MKLRPLILAGVLAGLLGGIAAALAIPHSTTRAPADPRAATAPPLGPTHVLRVGEPLELRGDVRLRLHGRPRIEARANDPLGGPEWAVRVFRADRVLPRGLRRRGVSPIIGRDLCAQLGRIHDGRFGWLDAQGTFRSMSPQIGGTEMWWCGSRRPDMGGHPHLSMLSTITDPAQPVARVKSTIVWGVAGSAVRRVDLRLAGRLVVPARTRHGAFLVIADGSLRQADVEARIRYPSGRAVREPERQPGPFGSVPPAAARQRVSARAPDPNGGLPFALAATRTPDGHWCTGFGSRVVGDRAGGVDYLLDVLSEARVTGGASCGGSAVEQRVFREHPVLLSWGGGSGPRADEGADPGGLGRIARRTQPGTTIVTGIAAPGVTAVTLETPRDVRTLVPTGPAHAIIAVYDGSFPTGAITIIARFRDGHTQRQEVPEMPF